MILSSGEWRRSRSSSKPLDSFLLQLIHQALLGPPYIAGGPSRAHRRCNWSLSRTWPCRTRRKVRPGSLTRPILPGFGIRSFMHRMAHLSSKSAQNGRLRRLSPNTASRRISYEADSQSLRETETCGPVHVGSGLVSVLNSRPTYNNCWFLSAPFGQHGSGCGEPAKATQSCWNRILASGSN
jgi:hypothetical protein